jgi:hypothetical protein
MCILSGIAISASLTTYMKYLDVSSSGAKADKKNAKVKAGFASSEGKGGDQREIIATAFVTIITFFLVGR